VRRRFVTRRPTAAQVTSAGMRSSFHALPIEEPASGTTASACSMGRGRMFIPRRTRATTRLTAVTIVECSIARPAFRYGSGSAILRGDDCREKGRGASTGNTACPCCRQRRTSFFRQRAAFGFAPLRLWLFNECDSTMTLAESHVLRTWPIREAPPDCRAFYARVWQGVRAWRSRPQEPATLRRGRLAR